MSNPISLLGLRRGFHKRLCSELVSRRTASELNIADGSQRASVELADAMLAEMKLDASAAVKTGQELGSQFASITADFLRSGLALVDHIRPGDWLVATAPVDTRIANFSQYAHLAKLEALLEGHPELETSLGGDYIITPDIVVGRRPIPDLVLNQRGLGVAKDVCVARRASLRLDVDGSALPLMHASISMKWTMRSDRAQNTRTEALNLIRNRKGRAPHVVVVTMEPLPSRIASIAMGTGDIDCTYHVALHELLAGAMKSARADQFQKLKILVEGNRLKDISDLVLDLAT